MNTDNFNINTSIKSLTQKEIFDYLEKFKHSLISIQSGHVNVNEYSEKLSKNAVHFTVYIDNKLVGLLTCYFNNKQSYIAYISSFGVLEKYQGFGIGGMLIDAVVKYGKINNFKEIQLEVYSNNLVALDLYKKKGFLIVKRKVSRYLMSYSLIEN